MAKKSEFTMRDVVQERKVDCILFIKWNDHEKAFINSYLEIDDANLSVRYEPLSSN